MKKTLLFLSGLFLTWTVSAQSFLPQNSGLTNIISSIDFVNDNVGMAVSYEGKIVKTINGGTNWTTQNSGTTTTLRDVVMIDSQTAIAIGYNGLILRTTNGGATWAPVSSGTSYNLTSIVVGGSMLYVVGSSGTVLKSSDMGATWTNVNQNTGNDLKTVYFISSTEGYVGGDYGVVFKTVNGGTSWTQLVSGIENMGINYQLVGMYFTDANNGFIIGGVVNSNQGLILRTTNAGASWTSQMLSNNYLASIDFINSSTGFISGGSITANSSAILKTTDGGNSWQIQSSSSSRQLGAAFPSFNAGYTCGLDGTILKITNIGLGMDELSSDIKMDVFPNPSNGHFNLFVEEGIVNDNTLVEVLNLNGEVVLEQQYQTNVDISDLMNGIYFLRVRNEKFSVTKKVIKE